MQNSEITQFVFHISIMQMDFFLTRTVEMLDKTNSAVFISPVDTNMCYQYFTSSLRMSRQNLGGKEASVCHLPLSVYIIILSLSA